MNFGIILGTRPEIIKMSYLIKLFENSKQKFILIHSKQHYDDELDNIFFNQLNIIKPHYTLNVGSGSHAKQTYLILKHLEPILIDENIDILLVHGDTNTTFAGALTASKLGIKVAHVEAGLRSFDKSMPEEINRVLTDHISDYLFAPTLLNKTNLLKENIPKNKIYVVGNTIVDIMTSINIEELSYNYTYDSVITLHRPSNLINKQILIKFLNSLDIILKNNNLTMILPMHPRLSKILNNRKYSNIKLNSPLGYNEFLYILSKAKFVLTDSGGIQEEASILGVPCLTIRKNTERPETISIGANKLISINDYENLETLILELINNNHNWDHPFGSGNTSQKIFDILNNSFSNS